MGIWHHPGRQKLEFRIEKKQRGGLLKAGLRRARLVRMLQDVAGDVLDGQHRLLAGGPDLGLGKEKAVSALIPEFKGEGVSDSLVVSPVVGASGRGV